MKLEVGMYVRTKDGYIDKILDISVDWYCLGEDEEEKPYKIYKLNKYYYDEVFDEDNDWVLESFLIKASHNIIDLIEVGDYINGNKVLDKEDYLLWVFDNEKQDTLYYNEEDIKSIVTSQQFESMKYSLEG